MQAITQRYFPSIRLLALFLGALLLLLGASRLAAEPDSRRVRVSGEAERRVAPDMATLQLQVIKDHRDAAAARAEADAVLRSALLALRRGNVEDEDIDSTGLSVEPQYRWDKETREQQLIAYRITRTVTVRVLNLEDLGILIESLSEAGVNRMQAPQLGLRDEERIYREVLVEAAVNARERAAAMASALGETLGDVTALATEDASMPVPVYRAMESRTFSTEISAGAPETYSAGDLTYRVRVSAEFALLDKGRQ